MMTWKDKLARNIGLGRPVRAVISIERRVDSWE